jgi:eukaryotic-like serine/threonine-protein kinase
MSSCPGEETLRLLGADVLGAETYVAIEQHVEGCPQCKAVLERLADRRSDPTVVLPGADQLPCIPGFEIQSELGRGAMGVVYLAIETGLDRLVALKILPGALEVDANSNARRHWLREARAVSSVRHPNVVPLYDYGEVHGSFYLVLEYVPGGSLKQRLAEPRPPRTVAGLMETIARAVGYVHEHGLFHLDLKPSNILLDGEVDAPWDRVTPRISDFGLALPNDGAGSSDTSLAGIRGTPSYMAPEQAAASRAGVGAAADIHALGAILYELLTGRPPFQGTSTLETLDQVRGQNPVPLRRLNPKLPRDLETIALKCLEKNPSRRYASAEVLAGDLRRWLDGRPIQARPVSPIEHAWRWCRRQRVIAALAATLFLTVIGSFVGLWSLLRRSETLRSRSEANYQVASRSMDDLLNIYSDLMNIHNSYTYHGHDKYQLWKAMESAHSQEIELSKRYPLDIRCLKRLVLIENCLATFCFNNGKQDEAGSLIENTIDCLETCLTLAPDDPKLHRWLPGQTARMLQLIGSNNDHLYQRWNARAIATLQRLKSPHDVHVRGIYLLSRCHRLHADDLLLRGESDRARNELEQDLNVVRSVSVPETAFFAIVLSEALTLAQLGQRSGEFALSQSPIHSLPANFPIKELELDLAELAARRIGWLPSIGKSPWLVVEDPPTDASTDRIISSMQSDVTKFGLDRIRIPTIGWRMWHHFGITLGRQRKAGKLGDAHRIVAQVLALAERLTQLYPDQAAAYMLLSEGYVQRAKMAYQVDGEPVIGWERKALEAAIQAAARESENEEAHGLVKDRRARLDRLASK